MASQISQQFAYRAQKSLGLMAGSPAYSPLDNFPAPEATARTYKYSDDGRLFAVALPSGVQIFLAESAALLREITLPNIVEINFSPRGTYLSTWERPVKNDDGSQHKNLRVFSVSTGEQLTAFTQKSQDGWDLQYTVSESYAVRLVGQEIQVLSPADWSKGVVNKLKVEGATSVSLSPGLSPSVAVFVGEKKGAPARIAVYGLVNLLAAPTCQKSFYKADRATIKWNTLGTQALVFTQTDVDNSNKSYYGETNLYLLSAAGNFDCRVELDKEGPIHGFAWSPNSKEFVVTYGFMPAKQVLFDQRTHVLHDFGSNFFNTVLFNPQGRLLLLAGFGNLAGKIDIYDRRSLTKVTTIDGSNTSHCEWSPDGRLLLTATLSPRLRVDNGIKIWHCAGTLLFVQNIDELYQASWRPALVDACPPFPQALPPAPTPHESAVAAAASAKPAPVKMGAYRPPGARGTTSSSVYKREEEGGPPRGTDSLVPGRGGHHGHERHVPGAGTMSPNGRYSRSPMRQNGRRHVPGAAPSPSPHPERQQGQGQGQGRGKRKGPRNQEGGADGASNPPSGTATPSEQTRGRPTEIALPSNALSAPVADSVPPTPGDALDPVAKKLRNLNKKLKAIDELKEKAARGERLEATQVKKIETEAELRKELESLS